MKFSTLRANFTWDGVSAFVVEVAHSINLYSKILDENTGGVEMLGVAYPASGSDNACIYIVLYIYAVIFNKFYQ